MERVSVPVQYTNPNYSVEQAVGVLAAEEDALVLEVLVKNALKFGRKPEERTARIDYGEVAEVTFRASLFANTLLVRVHSLQALAGVPFSNGPILHLGVARGDRPLAEELAATVMLRLSERRLNRGIEGTGA